MAGATNRFLTLTGDVFQDGELEDMTDALTHLLNDFIKRTTVDVSGTTGEAFSYLSDVSVIEKASQSVSGKKFKQLWNGDISN